MTAERQSLSVRLWRRLKKLRLQDHTNLFLIAGNIGILVTLWFGIYTFNNSTRAQSANFMLEFNRELRNGDHSFSTLIYAIDHNKPIIEPRGQFTGAEVDNYLVTWELMGTVYYHGLFDQDMIYDAFSYDVENTYCHPEIDAYIKGAKRDVGSDEYPRFEYLAQTFLRKDKTDCVKVNARK